MVNILRNAKEEDAMKPKKQKLKSEKTSMYDDIDDGTSFGVVTESLAGNLDNKQADIPIAKSEAAIKVSGHERPEAVIVDEIEEDLEQLPSPEHSEDKVKSQEKTEEDSKAKHDTPEPEQSTKEDLPEKSVEKERPKRSLYREKLLKSLNIDMVSDTFSPLTSRRRRNKVINSLSVSVTQKCRWFLQYQLHCLFNEQYPSQDSKSRTPSGGGGTKI